jgi:methylase of polypeptide subunit release factors
LQKNRPPRRAGGSAPADGPAFLEPTGLLLIEVAAARAPDALALAEAHPDLTNVRILKDSDGLPRVLVAEKNPR